MLKTKHLLLMFIPAILIASFVLFIRIVQFKPLYPKINTNTAKTNSSVVPIFAEDPVSGNKKATTTIIVFEDLGCSHCQEQTILLDQVIQKYGNQVKIIWKGIPVVKFPYSTESAHQYAYCAHQQGKYFEFAKTALANYNNLSLTNVQKIAVDTGLDQKKLTACLESGQPQEYLNKATEVANLIGLQVVPTIFFNNQQIPTPKLMEEWDNILSGQTN